MGNKKNVRSSKLDAILNARKKVSVIVPNFDVSNLENIKQSFITLLKGKYDYKLIFVCSTIVDNKNNKDKNIVLVSASGKTYNDQITLGFNEVEGDCAIICDVSHNSYKEYFTNMIEKWELGAKIVRLRYQRPNKNFFHKVANFFVNIGKVISNTFLFIFGINKSTGCYNGYQLFDKSTYDVIKNVPERNAYLRNYEVLNNFKTVITETDEKLKFPKDKLKWNKKFTTAIILLSVLVVFLALSVVLYPIAKANHASFTYIALMIAVSVGLLMFGLYFLLVPIIEYRIGMKDKF